MILKLSLDLPEDEAYIRTTRLLSRALLEDLRVAESYISDVETIVSELCSNVVRHAHSKETHFKVTLEYYEPKVVITVADEGQGFVGADIPAVGELRRNQKGGERLGGYGFSLVEGLSDKIDFTETDPHGTTVRIEKKLSYETPRDAEDATKRDTNSGGFAVASIA